MEIIDSTQTPQSQKVRPTFLTVICILTFIGSGWGIVKGVQNYFIAGTASEIAGQALSEAKDKMDNKDVPQFAKNIVDSVSKGLTPENIRKDAIAELISNILTLSGALMMWRFRKKGYYFYIAGIAILVISPMFIFGKGLIGLIASGMAGFIGVIFIVLYGVNVKHMTE
jgi:hypothetical protein